MRIIETSWDKTDYTVTETNDENGYTLFFYKRIAFLDNPSYQIIAINGKNTEWFIYHCAIVLKGEDTIERVIRDFYDESVRQRYKFEIYGYSEGAYSTLAEAINNINLIC